MGLEFSLVVGRAVCLLFAAIAFAVIMKAPNINEYSSFVFLAVASSVQMAWSAIRPFFQTASLWFGRPQPSNTALTVVIILEMVLTVTTMAAGCSSLGVVGLIKLDGDLPNSACPMYFTASTLVVVVGIVGMLLFSGMQWVVSFRYNFNTHSP